MNKEASKERSTIRKILLWVLRILLSLLLLIAVVIWGIDAYLRSEGSKVLDQMPFIDKGKLRASEIELNVWRHFPIVYLDIHDLYAADHKGDSLDRPLFVAKQLHLQASIRELLSGKLTLQDASLTQAKLHLWKDSSGYSNIAHFLHQEEKSEEDNQESSFLSLNADHAFITLDSFAFLIENQQKPSLHSGLLHLVSIKLQLGEQRSADIDLDAHIDSLGFNLNKGVFVENADLQGRIQASMHGDTLLFDAPSLAINQDTFHIRYWRESHPPHAAELMAGSEHTHYHRTRELLSANIQHSIKDYEVFGVFPTQARIQFVPELPSPLVVLKFQVDSLPARVLQESFESVSTRGAFYNHLHIDTIRPYPENSRNIRLVLQDIETVFHGMNVCSDSLVIKGSPDFEDKLEGDVSVSGLARNLSRFIGSKKFVFSDGHFQLDAYLKGALNSPFLLFNNSDARLSVRDFRLAYQPREVSMPFRQLTVDKTGEVTSFSLDGYTLDTQTPFRISGNIEDLQRRFFTSSSGASQTSALFEMNHLRWQEFVRMFAQFDNSETERSDAQAKTSLKAVFRELYREFAPSISIRMDTFSYSEELLLHDVQASLFFKDANTIRLDTAHLELRPGNVTMQAEVDILTDHLTGFELQMDMEHLDLAHTLPNTKYFNTPILQSVEKASNDLKVEVALNGQFLDTAGLLPAKTTGVIAFASSGQDPFTGQVRLDRQPDSTIVTDINFSGHPELINRYVRHNRLFFDDGSLSLHARYVGQQDSVLEIMNNADVSIEVLHTRVRIDSSLSQIPLDTLKIELQDNDAQFRLLMQPEEPIVLEGKIHNLTQLIQPICLEEPDHSIQVSLQSKKLNWDRFFGLMSSSQDSSTSQGEIAPLVNLVRDFRPLVNVNIDSLIYSENMQLANVRSEIKVDSFGIFYLRKTGLNLGNGHLQLDGMIDMEDEQAMPFETSFSADEFDMGQVLRETNYFNMKSLEHTEKLTGNLNMQAQVKGILQLDSVLTLSDQTSGLIDIVLNDLEIEGLELIDNIAKKVRMKKKLKNLIFAGIEMQVALDSGSITIPSVEFQSNGAQFFVDGEILQDSTYEIWFNIPLNNIYRTARTDIPSKTGFALAGPKIYLVLTQDDQGEQKIKLRLSKRKFFDDKGGKAAYKAFQKAIKEEKALLQTIPHKK